MKARLSAPYIAPPVLPEGYRRVGIYWRDDILQVVYSDGLYDLSVFEQAGRLRRRHLPPGGEPVPMAAGRAWRYGWAGGDVLLWEAGSAIYTIVSAAPSDELIAVARALRAPPVRPRSLVEKLRQASRSAVRPLAPS